jgi:hypothetical protein
VTVLILGRDLDPSADRLVEALGERDVPVFLLATPHHEVRLSEIRSVWYRHPSHFELPEGMSGPERRHATAEARVGLSGVCAAWMCCG